MSILQLNYFSFWFIQTSGSQILACIRIIWGTCFKKTDSAPHPTPNPLLIQLSWCRAWEYFNQQSQVILLQVVTGPYFKNSCPRLYTCSILVPPGIAILSAPLTVHESWRESFPWEFRTPRKQLGSCGQKRREAFSLWGQKHGSHSLVLLLRVRGFWVWMEGEEEKKAVPLGFSILLFFLWPKD